MAGRLLVGAEGIVLTPGEGSYASAIPVLEGLELVMMLMHFPTSRTVLVVGTEDLTGAAHFAKVHGIKGADVVGITPEDRAEYPALAQWHTIQRQRGLGPINLVLTAYREVYDRCTNTYQPVLLYGRRGVLGTLDSTSTWEDLRARTVRARDAAAEDPNAETEE